MQFKMNNLDININGAKNLFNAISGFSTGYMSLSPKGLIKFCSDNISGYFGKESEDLKNTLLSEFIHDIFKNEFDAFLQNVFHSNKQVHCKIPLIQGTKKSNLLIVKGIAQSEYECYLMLTDELDTNLSVEDLAEDKYRIISFMDKINDGVGIIDINGKFVYSNRICSYIFGVEQSELKNKNFTDFVKGNQQIKLLFEIEEKDDRVESIYEFNIVLSNGIEKNIRASFSAECISLGKQTYRIAIFRDISVFKKKEREAENRIALGRMMTQLTTDLIHIKAEYLNDWINKSLKEVGEFSGADRSYIFLFSDDRKFMSNTNEWCRENIEPQIGMLQNLPFEVFGWSMEKLKTFEVFHIPVVSELPPEAKEEKEILEAQDIKSLLILPLISNEILVGFVGFDAVTGIKNWSDTDIKILSHLSKIYGEAVTRLKFENELNQLNKSLEIKVEQNERDIENLNEINRLIIEGANVMLIKLDNDGIIKSGNPYSEEILGFKLDESKAEYKFSDLFIIENSENQSIPVSGRKDISGVIKGESETRESLEFYCNIKNEWKLKTRYDALIDMLVTISKLIDGERNTIGFVLIGINISERKKAEDLIRKSEMENRAIVQAVPDMMFKLNREGVFLDYINNSSIIPISSPDFFIGKRINDVLPESLGKIAVDALHFAFDTRQISSFEYIINSSGTDLFYENRIIAVSNDEAYSFVRNISDRKFAEKELIGKTQNLSVLIQSLNEGILFADKNHKITLVNKVFCDMFQIDSDTDLLIGLDYAQVAKMSLKLMKDTDGFIEKLNTICISEIADLNDEIILNNGNIYKREYLPVHFKNEIIGHLWQYRDITSRKKREEYAVLQRDLGFEMASKSTINEAMDLVIESVMKINGIHATGIYLCENDDEVIRLKKQTGLPDDFISLVSTLYKGDLKFELIKSGHSHFGFTSEFENNSAELLILAGFYYSGFVPIIHENQVLGSINISSRTNSIIDQEGKNMLENIASMLGGALQRLKIENELQNSQRNLNLMFETIDDFLFILDENGNVIKTNPIVNQRLGYTSEELSGISVLELHPPERREEAAKIVGEMLEKKREVYLVPLFAKDGRRIPVETKVVLGKWDGMDVIYGISRDITERLQAEEKLRKIETRWQFALEGTGDGLWDINLKTMEVYFSPQWKTMLGYSDSELENKYSEWESRVHPDDFQPTIHKLEEHLKGNTDIYMVEHRLRCKNGEYKWILDRGKVIEYTETGEPYRMLGTHYDISERKTFEEKLKKTIETEKELNELKSRFVSTASHEFRTPLASILMLSDIVLNYQHRMDNNSVRDKIKSIKDNVIHLSEIVNDVLQLSKIKEGKVTFNPGDYDLITICANVINGYLTTLQTSEILQFKTNFKSLVLKIDKQLISQALSNLVSNALKYSNKDPRVIIELVEQKNEILLTVKDNGIGIPEEDQKHLFTPFFRAGNVKTKQGNGLGLTIAKESTEMHEGYLSYISVINKGTSMTIHLPKKLLVNYRV